MQIGSYVGLLDLGLRNGVTKYTAQARASNDEAGLNSVVTTAPAVSAVVAALVVIASTPLAPILLTAFKSGGSDVPRQAAVLALVLSAGAPALPGSMAAFVLGGGVLGGTATIRRALSFVAGAISYWLIGLFTCFTETERARLFGVLRQDARRLKKP